MAADAHSSPLTFVKLGGSLITDKRHRSKAQLAVIDVLAREVAEALRDQPGLRLLLGHGSGSFGHWEASRYQTHEGVRTREEWQGFVRVSAAALQLNRIVTTAFVDAGVPVMSLQPSASAVAESGAIIRLTLDPLRRALSHGLVPLIFGDVAFDTVRGGTILSTEDLFAHLAPLLHPTWILLLGNAPGVLDENHSVIPRITPDTVREVQKYLRGSGYRDVTGGMADKVKRMVGLVAQLPELRVRIMSGLTSGNLKSTLLDPAGSNEGTLICS